MNLSFKKAGKYSLYSLLSTLLLVWIFFFILIIWPHLFINKRIVNLLGSFLPSTEISLSTLKADTKNYSALHKIVSIHFKDLCVHQNLTKPTLNLCIAQGSAAIEYDLADPENKIKSIGPIKIKDGDLQYTAMNDQESPQDKKSFQFPDFSLFKIPDYLANTQIRPLDIEFSKINYSTKSQNFQGKANLKGSALDNRLDHLKAEASFKNEKGQNYSMDLNIKSEDFFATDRWQATLNADIDLGKDDFQSKLNFDWDRNHSTYALKSHVKFNEYQGDFNISGKYLEDLVTIDLNLQTHRLNQVIENVSVDHCLWKLKKSSSVHNDGQLTFDCPITVGLKRYNARVTDQLTYRTPQSMVLDWSGQLETFFNPDLSHPTRGSTSLKIRSSSDTLAKTKGVLSADLEGIPINFPKDWKLVSNFEFELLVNEFKNIVSLLQNTPYAVWAPLHVLEGKVQLMIKGESSSIYQSAHVPVKFTTSLRSKKQNLSINAQSDLTISFSDTSLSKAFVKGEVNLNNVRLQLPHLNPITLPQVFKDKRIKLGIKIQKSKWDFPIKYDLRIKADQSQPILLNYYLANKPIPIITDMTAQNGILYGTIELMPFPAEFFRRQAKIQSIKLFIPEGENEPIVVDGLVGR